VMHPRDDGGGERSSTCVGTQRVGDARLKLVNSYIDRQEVAIL
jgi:hypothetical protein